MFEVPSAKRVKRSQLFNSDDEEEKATPNKTDAKGNSLDAHASDHEDVKDMPDYGFEYDFISPQEAPIAHPESRRGTTIEPSKSADKDPETYQFNLFAPSRPSRSTKAQSELPSSTTTSKEPPTPHSKPLQISIRSPSPIPETTTSGSLASFRPLTYYLTSALPPKTLQHLRTTYLTSAVTPATLTALSKLPWPGTRQPSRQITLPAHRKQIVIVRTTASKPKSTPTKPPSSTIEGTRRRTRPSKKRRDLIRARATKRQILIDETKTKEEHEREKRNKKNRERKLKRRAKERREKGAMKVVDGEGQGQGGSGEIQGDGAMGSNVSVSDDGSAT